MKRTVLLVALVVGSLITTRGIAEDFFCKKIATGFSIAGCSPTDFFTYRIRENGDFSKDVGLYQQGHIIPVMNHIATIHGMANDLAFCKDIAYLLEKKFPGDKYECTYLSEK